MRYLLLAVLFAVIGCAVPASASAEGYAVFTCTVSHTSNGDPIRETNDAHPATRGTAPAHTFAGNTSTNATSTVASLQAGSSTCNIPSFKAAFWFPTVISASGQVVLPYAVDYRIQNLGGPVKPTPEGLSFIHGNPMNTNPNATATLWSCTGVASASTMTMPPSCPVGAKGLHAAHYPHRGCRTTTQLGPGLQRGDGPADAFSHIAGSQACPGGERIPAITVVPKYPPEAIGGRVASDSPGQPGGTTWHLDDVFIDGRDSVGRSFIQRVTDMCLNFVPDNGDGNAGETCRVVNNTAAPGGKELRRISDGARVVDGGVSTTDPPPPPPPASTLDDQFDGASLDTVKWNVLSGTPTVSGGLCHLDNGDAVRSAATFRFAGKSVTAFSTTLRQMAVRDIDIPWYVIEVKKMGNNLLLFAGNGVAGEMTIPYSATAHKHLRLREAAGTLYWEASPDGTTWNVLRTAATPSWFVTRDSFLRLSGVTASEAPLDTTVDRVTVSS